MTLPLSRTLRFRDANIEVINLVNAPDDFDGVLVDKRGRVLSTWSSFMVQSGNESAQFNRGIPSDLVVEFLDTVRSGQPFYSLEAEFVYTPLFAARNLGLSEDWLDRLEANDPVKRRALSVSRLVAGTPAASVLENGDIVLAIDGAVVTSYREVERATRKPAVTVTLWRNGEVLDIPLETMALDGRGIDRVIAWAGALLQNPHRAMAAQRGVSSPAAFTSRFSATAHRQPATGFMPGVASLPLTRRRRRISTPSSRSLPASRIRRRCVSRRLPGTARSTSLR
jgi:hypothetical protein